MITHAVHSFKKMLPHKLIASSINSHATFSSIAPTMSQFLKSWCAMRGGLWQDHFFLNFNEILDSAFHTNHIILSIEYKRIKSTWTNEDLLELISSKTYKRLSSHPAFLALLASLFLEIENTEECLHYSTVALNHDKTALDGYFNLTCFALRNKLKISEQTEVNSSQILNFSNKLVSFKELFEGISKRTTIANIGNARCELGSSNGAHIDAHDIVIRFNNFPADPSFAKDYGEKCTIWVRTPSLIEVPDRKDINPYAIVFTGSLLRHMRNFNWKWMLSLCNRDVKLALFDDSTFRNLTNMLNAPPSAGILTVLSLHHLPTKLFKTNSYGFEFKRKKQNHYFDSTKASNRHNWEDERKLYSKLKAEQ